MTGARIGALGLGLAAVLSPADASARIERVEIELAQPIRPLAALAAERAVRDLPGVGRLQIDLRRGCLVVLAVPGGPGLDPRPMPRRLAGVGPGEMRLTVVGWLSVGQDRVTLEAGGALPTLLLGGAAWPGDPSTLARQAGQVLRVSGVISGLAEGELPRLTVQTFEVVVPDAAPVPAPEAAPGTGPATI